MRRKCGVPAATNFAKRVLEMTDLLMLAMGLGFFVIALAYVTACDRL